MTHSPERNQHISFDTNFFKVHCPLSPHLRLGILLQICLLKCSTCPYYSIFYLCIRLEFMLINIQLTLINRSIWVSWREKRKRTTQETLEKSVKPERKICPHPGDNNKNNVNWNKFFCTALSKRPQVWFPGIFSSGELFYSIYGLDVFCFV